MNLGRLEVLLGLLVLAGVAYLTIGLTHSKSVDMCTPLPLSQEVKAYIDSKVVASSDGACGEIPNLIKKLADVEAKMGAVDAYRATLSQRDAKKMEAEATYETVKKQVAANLQGLRDREIGRIKSQIGPFCAQLSPGRRGGGRLNGGAGGEAPPPSIPGVEEESKDSKTGTNGK